jgi:hypothetical protein
MSQVSIALLLLFAFAHADAASAARIFRCVDSEGTPVFADRPCHLLEAHSFPTPDTLGSDVPPVEAVAPGEDPALRASRCPAPDGTTLIAAVEDVFIRRDVNGFAALYHWVGATRSYAFVVMERMERLLAMPLLEVAFEPEMAEVTWSTDETELPDLRIDVGVDNFDDRRSHYFRLRRNAGCLWLVM